MSEDVTTLALEPRSTALVLIDLMPRIIALETAPLSGPAHEFAVSYIFPRFGTTCSGTEYVAALSPQSD